MSPAGTVVVSFDTGPDREGPSTWGQLKTFLRRASYPDDQYSAVLRHTIELADEAAVARVPEALRALLVAHHSLRTVYRDGGESQRLLGAGQLELPTFDLPDQPESITAVFDALTARRFDLAADLPVRAALLLPGGRAPGKLLLAVSHIAVDGEGLRIVAEDVDALVAGVADRAGETAARAVQPLDLATEQNSPRGKARNEAALLHWGRIIAAAPQSMLAVRAGGGPDPSGRYLRGEYRSSRAAEALSALSARTRASRQSVMLAATAALLSWRTGSPECVLTLISGNRTLPGTTSHVGSLSQDAIALLPAGTGTFDELVRNAWSQSLSAYRHSQVHPVRLQSLIHDIGAARGTRFVRDCVFNARNEPPQPHSPSREPVSELSVKAATFMPVRFYLLVQRTLGVAEYALWADTEYLREDDIRAFLTGVERLVVAAEAGVLHMERIGEISGIDPVGIEDGWTRVDSCLVDLWATRRLVASAAENRTTSVGVDAVGPAGEAGLVAYVDARGWTVTPEELHGACMTALPRFPEAMAPRHYVLCDGSPPNPDDIAGWREVPVLDSGSGRRRPESVTRPGQAFEYQGSPKG